MTVDKPGTTLPEPTRILGDLLARVMKDTGGRRCGGIAAPPAFADPRVPLFPLFPLFPQVQVRVAPWVWWRSQSWSRSMTSVPFASSGPRVGQSEGGSEAPLAAASPGPRRGGVVRVPRA
ncbi:hypothetical protein GCM10023084_67710 [Streptomyces lacrimifluminis]|uniref:Uncharacterized protein n=1 Tax=Streptomyces lacrimifluminis TaxID=1500077 RepID=A0A917L6G6_9ACTN|nr:hypothetical protein GCM10012282_44680 [Streptomyces lacrimifluminis]